MLVDRLLILFNFNGYVIHLMLISPILNKDSLYLVFPVCFGMAGISGAVC